MKKFFSIVLITIIFISGFLILTISAIQADESVIPCPNESNIPCGNESTIPQPPKAGTQTANLMEDNPIGASSISGVIGKIIQIFLGIIGTISLVMFIYGGFMMLTSAGTASRIRTGQQTLVWASIGILIVFTSYAVLKFVFSAFGI